MYFLFKGKSIKDPQAAEKQINDKTKQDNNDHPSEITVPSTTVLMEMGGDVTDASTSNQALAKSNAGGNLPPESWMESPSVSLAEADGASSNIAFSAANIGTGIRFAYSGSGTALRDHLNGDISEGQDKECPTDGSESYRLAQEPEIQLSKTEVDPGSTQSAPCNEAHRAELKEMAKENEDPGADSLLDTSQEKSFSEEPATDSSCSATLPPEQTHSDREKQRPSGKRRKKKRHSKSHSGSLFRI